MRSKVDVDVGFAIAGVAATFATAIVDD